MLAVLVWAVWFVAGQMALAIWFLQRRGRPNGPGLVPRATRMAALLLACTGGMLLASALYAAMVVSERAWKGIAPSVAIVQGQGKLHHELSSLGQLLEDKGRPRQRGRPQARARVGPA